MALFDRKAERDEDLVSGTDAASRALSVAAVENDFVEGVYDKLAKSTTSPSVPRCIPAVCRPFNGWGSPARTACSRSESGPASISPFTRGTQP